MDKSNLLVLVDGSSYLFRAFYALPALTGPNDFPTGAIHGVTKMIARLHQDYQPRYFAVVFDAPGKTFRHDWYPQYKANRPPMPDELRMQIEPLHHLITALGIPLVVEPDVEADDVIGTLVRSALDQHFEVVVSSGDKDLAQLLDDGNVTLLDTMKNEITRGDSVAQRFKVDTLRADQVIDFLALVGDTSDNIPGVPKVGPKTAAKWLNEYGSLDEIMSQAEKIKGKVGESLRASLDQLALSKRLATIRCDVDLSLDISDLVISEVNQHKLRQLCDDYGLNSIRKMYLNDKSDQADKQNEEESEPKAHYHLLTRMADFRKQLALWRQAKMIAIDTETTSIHYREAELVGISLTSDGSHIYYLPLQHADSDNLDQEEVLAGIRLLLEDEQIGKIGHHLKYDCHIFRRYGIEVCGQIDDSMLSSYIYDATACRHNLDDLADFYLNHTTIKYEDLVKQGNKKRCFSELKAEEALDYACEDAEVTWRLQHFFQPRLQAIPALSRLYRELEMPLSRVLFAMEERGVLVDADMLNEQSEQFDKRIQAYEQQAYELAGDEFNLGSPKQLQNILFTELGLPVMNKTATGQPSTNEDALQALSTLHELPACILNYRTLSKLKSTYTDKLPRMIDARSGRIHTSYHQAVTSTGRLSSSDPNLQNIPVKTEEGRSIRSAFIAAPGYQILACDYSQIELRIMAHLSGDEGLLTAFRQGHDIHTATAAEVLGKTLTEVSAAERRSAKAVNFGLIYGMSAFGLARQLGISRGEASAYIERYFKRYPQVKDYMDGARKLAKQQGFVETISGRRLYLPEIHSKSTARRQGAERLAINAPMQGSAADIIKQAMLLYWNRFSKDERIHLIMQVHDELVFEIREDAEELLDEVRLCMEEAAKLVIPLLVDCGVAQNWGEAH